VWANLLRVLVSFALLGGPLANHLSVLSIMVPMFVFGMGAAVASPAAMTQVISVNPQVIGPASTTSPRWAWERSARHWWGWEATRR
jgi:DHA1 family bicyclomycin/chloramphenicol resistance-like MFS transporter